MASYSTGQVGARDLLKQAGATQAIVEVGEATAAYFLGGDAADDGFFGDIFGDDGTTGDDCALADGDAGHDDHPGTDEDVVTNGDWCLDGVHIL